jgi:hypothetical protein
LIGLNPDFQREPERGQEGIPVERVNRALQFVERINRRDADGLAELMSPEHTFIDLAGDVHRGRQTMRAGWESYFTICPDYMIHLCAAYERGARVILVGRTTGSHLGQPRRVEFESGTLIWIIEFEGDRLSLWQLADDTPDTRAAHGLPPVAA